MNPTVCGEREGTYAGWNLHQKAGDKPCDRCLRAKNEYMRHYRRRKQLTRHVLVPVELVEYLRVVGDDRVRELLEGVQ